MDGSVCFSVLVIILLSGAPLFSSVPSLLVNNTGSNATGTVVIPEVGSPLEVWCWTEKEEASNRQWHHENGTRFLQYSLDNATNASVYVLKYTNMTFIKILKFRSYQTSQTGRYDCRIVLKPSAVMISLPICIGTPCKVEGVSVVFQTNAIPNLMVSWEAASPSSAVTYKVYYTDMLQDQPVNTNTASAVHVGLSITLSDHESIQVCTTYYVWVSAITTDTEVEGPFSDRASTETIKSPDKVDTPTVTRTVNSMMVGLDVSWQTPESSCTVSSYDIQYRLGSGNWSTRSTMTTSYQLSGLPYGSTYYIQVRAVSDAGNGWWSDEVQKTTYNVPEQVSGVVLTRVASTGNGGTTTSLMASWIRVDTDLPITSYSVQYKKTSDREYTTSTLQVNEGSAYSSEIPSLQLATEYTVRIAAVNQLGEGAYSTQQSTTTYGYASAPTAVTATPLSERGKISTSWTAPTLPTGSTITGYSIQYKIGSGGAYINATDPGRGSTNTTISGLQLGRTYQVRVGARTELGIGTNSSTTTQVTTHNYAPAPRTVTASPLSEPRKISVSWTPPTPPNGSTIIGYSIQYRMRNSGMYMSKFVTGSSKNNVKIADLVFGSQYMVRVATRTEIGDGNYSYGMPSAVTVYNVPSPVTNLTLKPLQNTNNTISLKITWSAPRSDVPITRYEGGYMIKSSGSWTGGFTTSNATRVHVYRNLDSGQDYEVRVRAVSVIGNGNYTIKSTSVPDEPNVAISSYNQNSIHLTWTRGGADDFIIYYGYAGATSTSHAITSTQYTITALESNTEYRISISGGNALGRTNSSVITVSTLPAAPPVTLTTLSSTSIKVQWTPPPNSDRLPLTYHVNYTGMSNSTTSTTLTLTRLHPYEEYTISVQAGNDGGLSVPVIGTTRTYSDKPSAQPRNRSVAVSSRWCILRWQIPNETKRNGVIIKYIIELGCRNGSKRNLTHELVQPTFSFPDFITHNVTNLTPYTTYMWRVAAATVNGIGPLSKSPTSFMTMQDVPGPVSKLAYSVQSDTSVEISWSEPEEPNGILLWYALYKAKLEGNSTFTCNISHSNVSSSHFNCTVDELEIHTPYTITVRAATEIGIGEVSSITVFTLEGVPTKSVSNVVAEFEDSNSVKVSWTPLTYGEAKGFPLYIVYYTSDDGSITGSVNTTNSSVTIEGLNPQLAFTFTVQITTGHGSNLGPSTTTTLGKRGTSANQSTIVGAVVGILVAIIILSVIIFLCVCIARRTLRKQSRKSYNVFFKKTKEGSDLILEDDAVNKRTSKKQRKSNKVEDLLYSTAMRCIPKERLVEITKHLHGNRDKGFEEEYQTIVNDPDASEAISKENSSKNRYINIFTYDHSRVVLSVPDEDGSDYINASFIDGYHRENEYIAVQGPTSRTVGDFWQMIWDQKPTTIVMVTKVEENGKKKCEQYWNLELKDPLEVGEGLEVTTTANKGFADYEVSDITLINNSQPDLGPHKLKHFHYTSWPDHGVPSQPSSLMKFVQKVRREYKDDGTPMVVHCSAGVGRTGTFIAVDTMMERLKAGESDLNIHSFVMAMRSRRTFMVQTMEQYVFIHDTLCEYLTCGDTSVAAHDLMSVISDMRDIDKNTGEPQYYTTFEILGSLSKTPVAEDESYSKKVGISKKNRYKNKFLYAGSNIRIADRGPSHNADYINASFINGYSRNKAFIAAQAPLENTKSDVWEMIWQMRVSTIVLLCDFKEDGESTCCKFWPDDLQKSVEYSFVKVNLVDAVSAPYADVITLEAFEKKQTSGRSLDVKLFHFNSWLANESPSMDAMLRLMGEVQKEQERGAKRVLVMCDDGMGRSGVFICAMSEVERVKVEGQVDVFQTIKGMRIQRPHMVETPDQYKLCFEILQSYLDSFDAYANFKPV